MKKLYVIAACLLMVALVLGSFGCAKKPLAPAPGEEWPAQISIGSFVKASASYPTNVAIAKLVGKYTPSSAIVREYAGGTPGIEALGRGDIDTWGIGQNDLYNAYYGTGFWEGKPKDIKLLIGTWYYGGIGFGVRPGEGIHTVKDLAGKKCMVRSFLPFQNRLVEQVMKYAGVWDKITVVEMASTADIAPMMIDKKIDCFWWSSGATFGLQIKEAVGIDWISLTPEEQEAGIKGIPGTVAWTAPAWILEMWDYPPDKVLRSTAYCFAIACRADIPDFVAYGMLAAVYDDNHLDEVRVLSPDLTETTIELAVKHSWMPFHPGAVRYYEDKGVWTKEMEARQQELLAKPR